MVLAFLGTKGFEGSLFPYVFCRLCLLLGRLSSIQRGTPDASLRLFGRFARIRCQVVKTQRCSRSPYEMVRIFACFLTFFIFLYSPVFCSGRRRRRGGDCEVMVRRESSLFFFWSLFPLPVSDGFFSLLRLNCVSYFSRSISPCSLCFVKISFRSPIAGFFFSNLGVVLYLVCSLLFDQKKKKEKKTWRSTHGEENFFTVSCLFFMFSFFRLCEHTLLSIVLVVCFFEQAVYSDCEICVRGIISSGHKRWNLFMFRR